LKCRVAQQEELAELRQALAREHQAHARTRQAGQVLLKVGSQGIASGAECTV
jgi:hypothetical protein